MRFTSVRLSQSLGLKLRPSPCFLAPASTAAASAVQSSNPFASVPTSTIGAARTLPSLAYTSPDVYAKEQQTVFRKNFLAVGLKSQVEKVGAYFTGQHFNR
jgi:hypothetical protein